MTLQQHHGETERLCGLWYCEHILAVQYYFTHVLTNQVQSITDLPISAFFQKGFDRRDCTRPRSQRS
jgi:hypothetical protein